MAILAEGIGYLHRHRQSRVFFAPSACCAEICSVWESSHESIRRKSTPSGEARSRPSGRCRVETGPVARMQARLDRPAIRLPWWDWALAAAIILGFILFPAAIPAVLYQFLKGEVLCPNTFIFVLTWRASPCRVCSWCSPWPPSAWYVSATISRFQSSAPWCFPWRWSRLSGVFGNVLYVALSRHRYLPLGLHGAVVPLFRGAARVCDYTGVRF